MGQVMDSIYSSITEFKRDVEEISIHDNTEKRVDIIL